MRNDNVLCSSWVWDEKIFWEIDQIWGRYLSFFSNDWYFCDDFFLSNTCILVSSSIWILLWLMATRIWYMMMNRYISGYKGMIDMRNLSSRHHVAINLDRLMSCHHVPREGCFVESGTFVRTLKPFWIGECTVLHFSRMWIGRLANILRLSISSLGVMMTHSNDFGDTNQLSTWSLCRDSDVEVGVRRGLSESLKGSCIRLGRVQIASPCNYDADESSL